MAQYDTVVIGISTDPLERQQQFTDKNNLNFPLFADTEGKVGRAFGTLAPGKNAAARHTFIIDKQGTIAKIYAPVKSAGAHPEEVLTFVKERFKK